jgi:hypothetical protein
MKRCLFVSAITLLAVVIAACGTPAPAQGPIEIELDDFFIEPAADTIAAGQIKFDVFNEGEFPHTLVVATNGGEVVYASEVLNPGGTLEVDLDLVPDTYQLTCRIVVQLADGQIIDHYQNGMGETIEVAG